MKAGAITDFNGKFTIRDLQLGGPYTVTVSFVGYKTIVQKGYQLGLGDKLKLNFNMSKGEEILDEVVITASSSDGFSKRENLGSAVSITGKTLEKIPTTSRNYEDLANLSPLSTPRLGLNEGSAHGGISVAGSNGGGTGFTLDGVNNRRSVFGGTADGPAFTISMEAIREFEIVTNSYDVSGPRSSGGAIKAVTRSGSNNWGGAAWSYGSGGSPKKIVFSFVSPEVKGFTLSGSLVAGQFGRFSAQSGVKTGANGQSLAYIPTDAEVTGTELTDPSDPLKTYNPYKGFAQMLSSTSSEYRDYINKNRGTFADFNAGAQAWSYSTNMSLIKGFSFAKKHKLTVRMDVFNALNLLGGYTDGAFNTVANTNLINVSDKNKYSIAKEAGRYVKGGDPFRVQLGLKYEF